MAALATTQIPPGSYRLAMWRQEIVGVRSCQESTSPCKTRYATRRCSPAGFLCHYNGFFDGLMGQQGEFNLFDFYAVASDFHLEVFSSAVLETAIGTHQAQVAGTVDAGVLCLRHPQEGSLREIWLAPIAQGKIPALDGNLSYLLYAYCLAGLIE